MHQSRTRSFSKDPKKKFTLWSPMLVAARGYNTEELMQSLEMGWAWKSYLYTVLPIIIIIIIIVEQYVLEENLA